MRDRDEIEFAGFVRATREVGLHLLVAGHIQSIAAAALLGKAVARAGVPVRGVTVLGWGERAEGETRAWLTAGRVPALLAIGLGVHAAQLPDVPVFAIDGHDDEPLATTAYRLGDGVAAIDDAVWCAAAGLLPPEAVSGAANFAHPLVERARGQHAVAELRRVAELLDAAARGPDAAAGCLMALDQLMSAATPQEFLDSDVATQLERWESLVYSEQARCVRVRPRAGYGVVVVEYASPCRIEDRVAARWRGLRPGTVVLVANLGDDGRVAITARAASDEALERLQGLFGSDGFALVSRHAYDTLLVRLGVEPAGPGASPN